MLRGTANASPAAWTVQAARNLFLAHSNGLTNTKALVRDRGSQFTRSFDEVFRTENIRVLTTPVRTPVANAVAERWSGTLRRELLDRTIIWNQRQLRRPLVDYLDHYKHPPPAPIAPATSANSCRHRRALEGRDAGGRHRDPLRPL